MNHVVVYGEDGRELGRIAYGRDGWDWRCAGCQGRSTDVGSASAALADFERHVERRHP